jgi:hypothetical protein
LVLTGGNIYGEFFCLIWWFFGVRRVENGSFKGVNFECFLDCCIWLDSGEVGLQFSEWIFCETKSFLIVKSA